MEKEKINEIKQKTSGSRFNRRHAVLAVLVAAVFLGAMILYTNTVSDSTVPKDDKKPRTKYQQVYVDCPDKYLELCTKMSKIPTEEVSFNRTENGRLYLDTQDGRTMVAMIEDGGENGYLIRIEE